MSLLPLLHGLIAPDPARLRAWAAQAADDPAWVAWLNAQGLAAYAFYGLRQAGAFQALPVRAQTALSQAGYAAIARAELQSRRLAEALDALTAAGVTAVLLKGAALASSVYPDPACRPMGDFDLWVSAAEMAPSQAALERLGYVQHIKAERPPALQALHLGEIQMIAPPAAGGGLVELHWGVFPGVWLQQIAAVPEAELRARAVPIVAAGRPALALAPEDAVIHVAVHLAVNHQMAAPWLRGLLDMALLARGGVDWLAITERAQAWRVATAVWLPLHLAAGLLGLTEAAPALARLRPPAGRRWLLGRFANGPSLLAMRNLTLGPGRFVYQLLLADRWRAAARLLYRGVWPTDDWLALRHGRSGLAARAQHLAGALRGRV
ncbi:MAG: nucleotidyltransferase family protein [Chloroflexi bacterium]|nr:nucleotidyltransferase family protein [Chloroflexota bacterium]